MENNFVREWGGGNVVQEWEDEDLLEEMAEYELLEELELEEDKPGRFFRTRVSPFENLTDYQFRRHFRFTKESVIRLTDFMEIPRNRNNRGRPVSAELSMCLFLSHVSGAHFNRTSGLCCDVSKRAAWDAIGRVRRCILQKKDDLIKMPTQQEMAATAERMWHRYGLPNFAMGIDGMLARFEEAPRHLPVGIGLPVKQSFWTRKMFYGINVLVLGNDQKIVHAIDPDWHGAAHDARIWAACEFKPIIEQQRRFLVAADSAFPISDVVIKPYPSTEEGDRRKKIFNTRLSRVRTIMTENIYGVLKKRFPWLKNMRSHYQSSKDTIHCVFALHNLAQQWQEPIPPGADGAVDDVPPVDDQQEEEDQDNGDEWVIREDNVGPNIIRQRGQEKRDQMMRAMRPRRDDNRP